MQHNNYKIIYTNTKLVVVGNSERNRFIVKVFLTNILQIFLSMVMTALVLAIVKFNVFLDKHSWIAIVLSFISLGTTIAIFFIRKFTHLKLLIDLLYTIFTFSFAGVITFLSISVEGMFIFLSWILAIILSIVLFIIGTCIKGDLIRYLNAFLIYTVCIIGLIIVLAILYVTFGSIVSWAIGLLILNVIIPASLIEAQILCGGKEIYYRSGDFILASMFHWFITTFSYSGFIFLFFNIRFS